MRNGMAIETTRPTNVPGWAKFLRMLLIKDFID